MCEGIPTLGPHTLGPKTKTMADSQAGFAHVVYFPEVRVLLLAKQGAFAKSGGFLTSLSFSRENALKSEKYPNFANWLENRPFFDLVCLGGCPAKVKGDAKM